MVKVVILNGAPRCGKGEGAQYLTNVINNSEGNDFAYHREFKSTLFEITAAMLGMSVEDFKQNYDEPCEVDPKYDWWKDIPMYIVGDNPLLSKRGSLIHASETVIKPFFGKSAFGIIEANKLPEDGWVFYSDGGFPDEIKPLIDKVGAENVLVIHIHKGGCTFEGDSRNWLQPYMFEEYTGLTFESVDNVHGELDKYHSDLENIINRWVSEKSK